MRERRLAHAGILASLFAAACLGFQFESSLQVTAQPLRLPLEERDCPHPEHAREKQFQYPNGHVPLQSKTYSGHCKDGAKDSSYDEGKRCRTNQYPAGRGGADCDSPAGNGNERTKAAAWWRGYAHV